MNKQVKITGSTHAFAVVMYGLQAALGLEYIFGVAEAKSMTTIAGAPTVMLWALALIVGGTLATAAALNGPRYPRPALLLEQWACAFLAVASLWYEITLAIGNGLTVMHTQTQAVAVFVASTARAIQVHRERVRITAAEVAQSTAAKSVNER
ncbi:MULTISPECIES: hypothetical protein [unclassified Brevibacterium]|uniref:hypothetical protein n=1 Tax=unclassified Brevibacterium TaxID=2614124 RepID=UPI001E2AEA04|nr:MULTISPECIES: hypothetical protein [unclassified Brevibacterium]MDK8436392.1 hypothetical protein [Brevibacterium sp. H-BE7]